MDNNEYEKGTKPEDFASHGQEDAATEVIENATVQFQTVPGRNGEEYIATTTDSTLPLPAVSEPEVPASGVPISGAETTGQADAVPGSAGSGSVPPVGPYVTAATAGANGQKKTEDQKPVSRRMGIASFVMSIAALAIGLIALIVAGAGIAEGHGRGYGSDRSDSSISRETGERGRTAERGSRQTSERNSSLTCVEEDGQLICEETTVRRSGSGRDTRTVIVEEDTQSADNA